MSEPLCDNHLRATSLRNASGIIGCLLFIVSLFVPSSRLQAQLVKADTVITTTSQPVSAHNPTKAVLLSLLPGAGQIYNGQAWKIPIIYGALGGVGYFTYTYYTQMKAFKDE